MKYPTGSEILTVVLHHAEKGLIGPGDHPFEVPHSNAHNIGFDQAPPDSGFHGFQGRDTVVYSPRRPPLAMPAPSIP